MSSSPAPSLEPSSPAQLEGGAGSLAALVLVLGLCAFLVRAGRSKG